MLIPFAQLGGDASYPVVIVGAGAAGITLAKTLAGKGIDVLLSEAGGFELEQHVQQLYKGQVIGQPYWLGGSRLHYFGGTTNHWSGQSDALDPLAFAHRSWVPYSGWPIDHDALAPYYKSAFQLCNLGSGPQDQAINARIARIFPPRTNIIEPRIFYLSHPVQRFGETFREEIVVSSKIHLVLHAVASELLTDSDGERVISVRFKDFDGRVVDQPAQVVVIACGGIDNARILLASNRTRAAGLGNEYDLVGRFFMDHPGIVDAAKLLLTGDVDISSTGWSEYPRLATVANTLLTFTAQAQERHEMTQLGIQFYNRTGEIEPSVKAEPAGRMAMAGPWRGAPTGHTEGQIAIIMEQSPNPDSRVRLDTDRDALGMPRIVLDWRLSALDRHTLRRASELAARELGRLGLARLQVSQWVYADEMPGGEFVRPSNHHMGTTRMSWAPASGVVDPNCRVHSLPNLYVAGSSVFPAAGLANQTVNIVALTLRLADHLESVLALAHCSQTDQYCLGDNIFFTKGGDAGRYQGTGWSYAEESGTWTIGTFSELMLPLAEIPRSDLLLVFEAHPLLGPHLTAQSLRVEVNGTTIYVGKITHATFKDYRIRIPRRVVASGRAHIRFDLMNATAPADLGLNSDKRVLGIKVKKLLLVARTR